MNKNSNKSSKVKKKCPSISNCEPKNEISEKSKKKPPPKTSVNGMAVNGLEDKPLGPETKPQKNGKKCQSSDLNHIVHKNSVKAHDGTSSPSEDNIIEEEVKIGINAAKTIPKNKTANSNKLTKLDSNDNISKSHVENKDSVFQDKVSCSISNNSSSVLQLCPKNLPACSSKNEEEVLEKVLDCEKESLIGKPTTDKDEIIIDDLANDLSKKVLLTEDQPTEEKSDVKKDLPPIKYVQYESELQMPMIMKIIQKDLSEPYSIYTYRYFIHNWPKLCFLAMCEDSCVGAIVCKLDLHRKVIRRGYIAMLAVDQNYRKLGIGSTLVRMAIQEMISGDADEVVLETEVTNKPALQLYEALGFVRDKRLFRYYLNGVDALRLKLWLR